MTVTLGNRESPYLSEVYIGTDWDHIHSLREGHPTLRLHDARVRGASAPMGFERMDVTVFADDFYDDEHDASKLAVLDIINPQVTWLHSGWQEITGTLADAMWYTDADYHDGVNMPAAFAEAKDCTYCNNDTPHKVGAPYIPPKLKQYVGRPVLVRVSVRTADGGVA